MHILRVDPETNWDANSLDSLHNKRAFCPLLALIHPHSAHNVLEKERFISAFHRLISHIVGLVQKDSSLNRLMWLYPHSNTAPTHASADIEMRTFRRVGLNMYFSVH